MRNFFQTSVPIGPLTIIPKRDSKYLGAKLIWQQHIKRTTAQSDPSTQTAAPVRHFRGLHSMSTLHRGVCTTDPTDCRQRPLEIL